MKKVFMFLFIAMFAMTAFGQGRKFAEVFVGSSRASDEVVKNYLSTYTELCASNDLIYVAYYQYTGEDKSYWSPGGDGSAVYARLNHLSGLDMMPDVYLMGQNLMGGSSATWESAKPERWTESIKSSKDYTVFPFITSTKIDGHQITVNVTLSGTLPTSSHIIVALSENLSDAAHVFRQYFTTDGANSDGSYTFYAYFDKKYNPDHSEVTVFVEDETETLDIRGVKQRAIVGAIQVPYTVNGSGGGYFMGSMGINNIGLSSIKMYPNPVQNELTITSDNELTSIRVVDVTGKLVINKTSKDGLSGFEYKLRTDFSSGIYFVTVNEQKPVKIVKQ